MHSEFGGRGLRDPGARPRSVPSSHRFPRPGPRPCPVCHLGFCLVLCGSYTRGHPPPGGGGRVRGSGHSLLGGAAPLPTAPSRGACRCPHRGEGHRECPGEVSPSRAALRESEQPGSSCAGLLSARSQRCGYRHVPGRCPKYYLPGMNPQGGRSPQSDPWLPPLLCPFHPLLLLFSLVNPHPRMFFQGKGGERPRHPHEGGRDREKHPHEGGRHRLVPHQGQGWRLQPGTCP